MNKHIVKYLLALATVVFVGGGCNVDDYNTEYLDGFDPDPIVTDVQNVRLTLSDAEYGSVASNATNKAIAEAAGEDAVAALEAVGKNKCFSEAASAATYLPAFIADKYDSYLDNNSSVTVTYKNATNLAEEVIRLAAAETYTVSGEDYKSVWGEVTANYFTPEKPLAGYAGKILAKAYPEAESGTVKVVAYNYSATEPNSGGGETPAATSIDEGFDTGLGAWQIVVGSSSATWTLDDYEGAKSAKCTAFKTTGAQDLWLISEKVDLSATENPQLGFDVKISYRTHDGLSVLVSTDYNGVTPEDATWTDITSNFTMDGSTSGKWYPAGICDMSAYKAEAVYIAFRYVGNATDKKTTTYQIDNIQLGQDVVAITEKKIFDETFDKFDNWTLKSIAGEEANQWKRTEYSGNSYAQCTANKAAGAVESWLVTKDPIAVPAFEEGITVFGFDLKIGFWNADCLSVLVSEDFTGDVATATWKDVTGDFVVPQTPTSGYASGFSTAGFASLYSMAGKSVYIAFKYLGDGANKKTTTYQIDNFEVKTLKRDAAKAAAAAYTTRAVTRAVTQQQYAVYTYNGTAWTAAEATTIVNPADYEQMGASNPNFSSSFSPDTYLPLFLKYKFPYAQPEDVMDVAYHFYASNATKLQADRYTFDGTDWNKSLTYEMLDGPFKKIKGKWSFDPSMTIVLSPTSNVDISATYYQAAVDWVKANKDAQYLNGAKTEYYSGCAAGYYNLNWRINTLPWYYWKVVEGEESVKVYEDFKSDDPALVKAAYEAFYTETEKRFGEVMAGALGTLHADVKMIPGIDVIYTVQAYLYTMHHTDKELTHAFEFKLVADGKFEYVRMYALDPKFELMSEENFK